MGGFKLRKDPGFWEQYGKGMLTQGSSAVLNTLIQGLLGGHFEDEQRKKEFDRLDAAEATRFARQQEGRKEEMDYAQGIADKTYQRGQEAKKMEGLTDLLRIRPQEAARAMTQGAGYMAPQTRGAKQMYGAMPFMKERLPQAFEQELGEPSLERMGGEVGKVLEGLTPEEQERLQYMGMPATVGHMDLAQLKSRLRREELEHEQPFQIGRIQERGTQARGTARVRGGEQRRTEETKFGHRTALEEQKHELGGLASEQAQRAEEQEIRQRVRERDPRMKYGVEELPPQEIIKREAPPKKSRMPFMKAKEEEIPPVEPPVVDQPATPEPAAQAPAAEPAPSPAAQAGMPAEEEIKDALRSKGWTEEDPEWDDLLKQVGEAMTEAARAARSR